ncbi:YpmS family protein [Lactococcus nasutitermitis]|uniref:YpmS family protein n=1 Tax=Lactococcus nasutitermitis TaxID=1652957 RepID=A0ABV9JIT3_9LACT|nr:YpmS family protein [Lactococcus nasutitermitis]
MENHSRKSKQTATKEKKPKKRLGIWKWLFLLLLAINLATFAFVAVRILTPRDQAVLQSRKTSSDQKVAEISSTTSQLNQLINSYLADYQTKNMSYKFYVSDEAVLNIEYKIMGVKVPIYIYFEPLALPDGSVSLSVKSISAGSLSLPTEEILQMVKGYNLPKFVEVDSSKSQIIIHLPQLAIAKNLYVKANQLNLVDGKFSFDLVKKG